MVIAAIGQAPDSSFLADDLELFERGKVIHIGDPDTLATTRSGVFAGGDAVTGPATAVRAIAAGKRAAISIDSYLREESLPTVGSAETAEIEKLSSAIVEKTRTFARCEKTSLPVDDRIKGFDEVESVLSEDLAAKEALRCLHCYLGAKVDKDRCVSCLTCVRVCPLSVPTTSKMGEISIDPFACQACGMCALECPVQAIDISLNSRSEIAQEIEKGIGKMKPAKPVIVGFFDLHGDFGPKHVTSLAQDYPNVLPITVFGLRRIDTSDILKAFECGADGVLLAACPSRVDPFPEGTDKAKRRVDHARSLLEALGMQGECVEICEMPQQGLAEKELIDGLAQKIMEASQTKSA
jgi:ferredoxin